MRRIFSLSVIILLLVPTLAFADAGGADQGIPAGTDANGPKCISEGGSYTCLRNPLGNTTSIPVLVGRIVNAGLGIVGSIAFLMFIFGGFKWLTSAGNEQKVKEGTEVMKWSLVGLVVVLGSVALVRFVLSSLGALN